MQGQVIQAKDQPKRFMDIKTKSKKKGEARRMKEAEIEYEVRELSRKGSTVATEDAQPASRLYPLLVPEAVA